MPIACRLYILSFLRLAAVFSCRRIRLRAHVELSMGNGWLKEMIKGAMWKSAHGEVEEVMPGAPPEDDADG